MISMNQVLLLFMSTFILVSALTPIMRQIAIKVDFVDYPNVAHKSHKVATPYLGGVAIIIGILVVVYAALFTQENMRDNLWIATSLFGPALLLGFLGLIDDRKALNPLPRFIAQTIAGIFTATLLILSDTVGNPSGNVVLDVVITVVWIVGIINSINFFDNLDGGAAGAVAVSAFGLFVITQANGQYLIAASSIAITGAMLGFLIWNKSPARIYMGDAGSLFLGTLLATLTVRLDPDAASKTISFAIPLFLLAVPVLDTTVAVISRIRRGTSIFQGGQDHLSHRLLRKGLTKYKCVQVLWSLSLVFAGISIIISTVGAVAIYFFYIGGFFWLILVGMFLTTADD
jgi:UDP-GlcNAc:undecaprenyl-phosphate/decaprenyl-phosphate GlcNAc-1-phosphate transferase